MSDERKKALEAYAKRLQFGDSGFTGGIVPLDKALGKQAYDARNITEEALAHQVLKNTGIPIPDASNTKQVEDFLARLVQEQYPEINAEVSLNPGRQLERLAGGKVDGYYFPDKKYPKIRVNQDLLSKGDGLLQAVATAIHEGAHGYDNQKLKYKMPEELMKTSSQLDIKGMYDAAKNSTTELDPTELYEIAAKGHHARIPDLRDADSFGLGALKSYMKSGKFKQFAGPIAGAGLTAAILPDNASAVDFVPGLDQAENAGDAMDDHMMKTEVRAKQNYDASNARRDALRRMSGRQEAK